MRQIDSANPPDFHISFGPGIVRRSQGKAIRQYIGKSKNDDDGLRKSGSLDTDNYGKSSDRSTYTIIDEIPEVSA